MIFTNYPQRLLKTDTPVKCHFLYITHINKNITGQESSTDLFDISSLADNAGS